MIIYVYILRGDKSIIVFVLCMFRKDVGVNPFRSLMTTCQALLFDYLWLC